MEPFFLPAYHCRNLSWSVFPHLFFFSHRDVMSSWNSSMPALFHVCKTLPGRNAGVLDRGVAHYHEVQSTKSCTLPLSGEDQMGLQHHVELRTSFGGAQLLTAHHSWCIISVTLPVSSNSTVYHCTCRCATRWILFCSSINVALTTLLL